MLNAVMTTAPERTPSSGSMHPVCLSGDGFVSCNGQVTYCDRL